MREERLCCRTSIQDFDENYDDHDNDEEDDDEDVHDDNDDNIAMMFRIMNKNVEAY